MCHKDFLCSQSADRRCGDLPVKAHRSKDGFQHLTCSAGDGVLQRFILLRIFQFGDFVVLFLSGINYSLLDFAEFFFLFRPAIQNFLRDRLIFLHSLQYFAFQQTGFFQNFELQIRQTLAFL